MKTKFLLILALAFSLALPCLATNKIVTSVSATASTLLNPGQRVQIITIANEGLGDVRISTDGGSTNGLPDPTASSGYLLKAGNQIILTYTGTNQIPKIRVILTTATTTTLVVTTNDAAST